MPFTFRTARHSPPLTLPKIPPNAIASHESDCKSPEYSALLKPQSKPYVKYPTTMLPQTERPIVDLFIRTFMKSLFIEISRSCNKKCANTKVKLE
jgi:hypothetical protein